MSVEPSLFEAAVARFLEDITRAGSPRSASTYRAALGRFRQFLAEDRRPDRDERRRRTPLERAADEADAVSHPEELPQFRLIDLTVDDALNFVRWFEDEMSRERGHAPSQATTFTYTAAIQSFYSFIYREGLRSDLDLEALRQRLKKLRGRRIKSIPRVPGDDVVEELLRVASMKVEDPGPSSELIRLRDIALLETLRSSGLRVSEAVSLKRDDFDFVDRSAIVRGKGGKDRVVFFSEPALTALRAYWRARGDERITRHVGALPSFARHNRQAAGKVLGLSAQGVRYVIEQIRARAGEEWPVTPHRLRAWFATYLLDNDVNLAEVQDLLGHESANTTRIYTKVRPRRLQEAHRRAFSGNE
jgi:site-specific recombinase XerD